jgi:hypothetical protein
MRGVAIAWKWESMGLPCHRSYPLGMPGPGESVKPAPTQQLYKLPDEVTPEEIAAFDENDPVDPEAVLRWLETGEADPWGESSG